MGQASIIVGVALVILDAVLGERLGSGPRDGLMVALTKKTSKSVRFLRNAIETSALILG